MQSKAKIVGASLLCVLVSSTSCKKDDSSTTTAAARAGANAVALLEAGAEPHAPLRYKIAEGTITQSTMDFTMATLATTDDAAALSVIPGVRLHIVSGPASVGDDGVRFGVNVEKAEAAIPQGLDPEVAEDLRASAAILDDVGGTVKMNDRGIVLATELNDRAKSSDIPVRLLTMIVNARTTLSRVALPVEPVGLGARWEAHKEVELFGFRIQQVNTYTLVERIGDEIKLNVTVTQNALPQTIDFPDEGISITAEQMTANAHGEIVLNLNALEADAFGSGESDDRLVVSGQDGSKTIEVNEAFEIRMMNTTAYE